MSITGAMHITGQNKALLEGSFASYPGLRQGPYIILKVVLLVCISPVAHCSFRLAGEELLLELKGPALAS